MLMQAVEVFWEAMVAFRDGIRAAQWSRRSHRHSIID